MLRPVAPFPPSGPCRPNTPNPPSPLLTPYRPLDAAKCARALQVPAPFLIRTGLSFIRTLAPTLVEDILGDRPYFLNPLCQTIQVRAAG